MNITLPRFASSTARPTARHSGTSAQPSTLIAGTFGAASRFFGTAALPVVDSRAKEAEEVRELAWSVRHSDPGFSADLYAAAARHEGLND